MRPTAWNPAAFTYDYLRADLAKRRRMWDGMKYSERQLYLELDMFRRFAHAAGIEYSSESELTLDPNSTSPPPPDIVYQSAAGARYVELGEVVEEGLAAEAARAQREKRIYGGSVDIWRPVLRVFSKKLRKRYNTSAAPLALLLHYGVGRQPSFWPFLAPRLPLSWIQKRVDHSRFDAVWLYDAHGDIILARFGKGEPPFVRQAAV
jgi:hypothetical protein